MQTKNLNNYEQKENNVFPEKIIKNLKVFYLIRNFLYKLKRSLIITEFVLQIQFHLYYYFYSNISKKIVR